MAKKLLPKFFQLAFGLPIDGLPPCMCNCLTCKECIEYVCLFMEVDYLYSHNSLEGHFYHDSLEDSSRCNHDRLLVLLQHFPEILLLFEEYYFKIQPTQALFKQAYDFPEEGDVIKTVWEAEIRVVKQGLVFFEVDGIVMKCPSTAGKPSDAHTCEATTGEPSEAPQSEATAAEPLEASTCEE